MSKFSDAKIRPTAEYLELLFQRARAANITPNDIGYKSGSALETRLFRMGERGDPSVTAANAYARELEKRGVHMPPPVVAIIDDEDYEWISLGRQLREANQGQFTLLLTALRASVKSLMDTGLRKSQETVDKAARLVASRTKQNARVKRRRGESD